MTVPAPEPALRVSICIPTYNRSGELRLLLDSIAEQTGHGLALEIAISDNASTDNTGDLVAQYQAAGLPIVYCRFAANRGFDANLVNAVAIASGDYCWLFGSDDLMEPGALASLEQALRRYPGVAGISVGLQAYNADLSRRIPDSNQIMNLVSSDTLLSGRDTIVSTVCTCFGFISSIVVRPALWQEAAQARPLKPYFKGYVHLYLIASMLDEHSAWLCLPRRMAGYRTGNDSFRPDNEFARTRLDIVGYDLAFGDVLGRNNPAYHRSMAKVAVTCIGPHFATAKKHRASAAYWKEAIPVSIAHYWRYPSFWLRTLPIALIPGRVFLAARRIYRHTLRPIRDRRRQSRQLSNAS